MDRLKGIIYTERFRFEPGIITIEGDRIYRVETCDISQLSEEEAGRFLIPGLVDIHVHGCAGYDFGDASQEALEAIEDYESRHGITSYCMTTMTLPTERLEQICDAAAGFRPEGLRGIYLEGPFLSKEKCGAQNPAYLQRPDPALLERLQERADGLIRIVAIAPELEGAIACIEAGKGRFGFSMAHSAADYDTAVRAIESGASQVTHLYNAMPPFSHREPGIVGAAADKERVRVELICDGIHVHPGMVRSTFKLFGAERILLISDSMMAAGMKDGAYTLGGQPVWVSGSRAVLQDGTIAGSVSNLYDCMLRAVSMGIPKEDAVRAATCNPAQAIGMTEVCGILKEGRKADLLITDRELGLHKVIKGGRYL